PARREIDATRIPLVDWRLTVATLPDKTPAQALANEKRSLGQGVFRKCIGCGAVHTAEALADSWQVCPACGYHHPMTPADWRALLLDDERLERWDEHVGPGDPLSFNDGKSYRDRLERAKKNSGQSEALEVGRAALDGHPIAYGCYVFGFMGG